MNFHQVSIAAVMSVGLATLPSFVSSASPDSAFAWWQTECVEGGPSEPSVSAVLRHFEAPKTRTEDPERLLVVQDRGLQYRVDAIRGSVKWESLDQVVVEKVGSNNPALSITIIVHGVPIGGNPFGVIEYPCWRSMEAILRRHVPEKIQGSPPLPHAPLFDKEGNVVSE
jgi:hypothetical protein